MPRFLNPSGHATYGLGICARCQKKMFIDELYDDPNYPGLKVCLDDMDELDPYRLPPREPDPITLPFTRPDEPLTPATSAKPGDPGWPPADSVSPDGQTYIPGT